MPDLDKIYIENPAVPGTRDYPLVAVMGNNSLTKPYMRNDSFQDLLSSNKRRETSSYDLGSIDPNAQNEFLNIPSFLYYPQDLGRNQRYHHFMTFNIYQGSSDQVRLDQRILNQYTSAMLAKGSDSLTPLSASGSIAAAGDEKSDGYKSLLSGLTASGFSEKQAKQFLNAYANHMDGQTYNFQGRAIKSDERINVVEDGIQGKLQNILNNPSLDISTLEAGGQLIGQGVDELQGFLSTLVEANSRNYLDPANQPRRNFDEVGVSGKKVNRDRSEQNILLANRRFNLANVKSKDVICLYMPLKISFNDQLVYSEEDMGMAKAAMDTYLGKRGGASALIERAGVGAISNLIDSLTSKVGLEALNLQAVRSAATRSVSNPRREVLFKDVALRTHSFTFDFYPKNSSEAQSVLDIIRLLRYHAYPGLRGGGGHFFTFPAEFEVIFHTITPEGAVMTNDHLPKLPRLALQSVSVDYSAAGDYKTFPDAKPAFIRLDLQFQEMEQLTNEHIIHGY